MKNPILALIAIAAAAMPYPGKTRTVRNFTPPPLPRTGDRKSPIPVNPTIHDLVRIEEAKARRITSDEKRARNIAKSKVNNYH